MLSAEELTIAQSIRYSRGGILGTLTIVSDPILYGLTHPRGSDNLHLSTATVTTLTDLRYEPGPSRPSSMSQAFTVFDTHARAPFPKRVSNTHFSGTVLHRLCPSYHRNALQSERFSNEDLKEVDLESRRWVGGPLVNHRKKQMLQTPGAHEFIHLTCLAVATWDVRRENEMRASQ
ncbi:hypothetical protein NMY22_g14770 [Coprinellus aureogranulatus]|nr:hypothetical protein NMY22_g14770 [Coprinellus aureogranulatus]